jgi:hypothetical protein
MPHRPLGVPGDARRSDPTRPMVNVQLSQPPCEALGLPQSQLDGWCRTGFVRGPFGVDQGLRGRCSGRRDASGGSSKEASAGCGVSWHRGQRGRPWAGRVQAVPQPVGVERSPRVASRARLTASEAASSPDRRVRGRACAPGGRRGFGGAGGRACVPSGGGSLCSRLARRDVGRGRLAAGAMPADSDRAAQRRWCTGCAAGNRCSALRSGPGPCGRRGRGWPRRVRRGRSPSSRRGRRRSRPW